MARAAGSPSRPRDHVVERRLTPDSPLSKVRIASVPYLNAAPLVHGLPDIRSAVPSRLAHWLDSGECDLAVLSIGAALERPDWRVLPDLGVAADGAVRTVLVLHSGPLNKIRRLRLDPASRTSNLLAQIVVEESAGTAPEITDSADARVVIGDPAFAHDPDREGTDLARAWKDHTGLPMVFAGWIAGRRLSQDAFLLQETRAALLEAWRANMANLTEIVESQTVVPPETARAYFRENIHYPLDQRFHAGADLFARKAAALGCGSGSVPWA